MESIKQFGVFGNPIHHSLSPTLFNFLFSNLKLQAQYHPFLLPLESSPIHAFLEYQLQGANVTVPFKEKAFHDCHEVRGEALEIGSVNTLVLESDKVIGYNTDARGFYLALSKHLIPQRALIIGAGGSARAIAYILRHHHIPVIIANRSPQRLESFAKQGYEVCLSAELDCTQGFDLLINTTTAGLQDSTLPLPHTHAIALMQNMQDMPKALVCDIIYGRVTPFLALARDMHIQTCDGLDMLYAQAAFSAIYYLKHIAPTLSIDADKCLKLFPPQ